AARAVLGRPPDLRLRVGGPREREETRLVARSEAAAARRRGAPRAVPCVAEGTRLSGVQLAPRSASIRSSPTRHLLEGSCHSYPEPPRRMRSTPYDSGTCQIPRPCVAARRISEVVPGFAIARSNTAERGRPVPYGVHVVPPLVEAYTPMSVPANRCAWLCGSITNAFTGTSGMRLP